MCADIMSERQNQAVGTRSPDRFGVHTPNEAVAVPRQRQEGAVRYVAAHEVEELGRVAPSRCGWFKIRDGVLDWNRAMHVYVCQ